MFKPYKELYLISNLSEEEMKSGFVTTLFSVEQLTYIINKTNPPSLKEQTDKLKWTDISDFEFNNNNYYILAYDMNKPTLATA